jgi:hypothetical protein
VVVTVEAPQPNGLRLRVLAAAVGSIVSALAALVTAPTIILGIIGVVGVPVGAIIGFVVGPRLARERAASPIVVVSSIAAVPLGVGIYTLFAAVAQGRGASLLEIVGLAFPFALYVGLYALILGFPMALVVAAIAAQVFRRLAPRVDRLWVPSAVVVGLVATLTLGGLVGASANAGDQAAQRGDTVHFRYRVDNLSDEERSMEVRSFWNGTEYSGSSGLVGIGRCTSSGDDWLLASDWAIWMSPADSQWVDRPAGDPVITSAAFGQHGSVELTIVINPDGSAVAIPGIQGAPC